MTCFKSASVHGSWALVGRSGAQRSMQRAGSWCNLCAIYSIFGLISHKVSGKLAIVVKFPIPQPKLLKMVRIARPVRKRWTERGPQDELTLVVSGTNSMSKESTYNVWVAHNFSKSGAQKSMQRAGSCFGLISHKVSGKLAIVVKFPIPQPKLLKRVRIARPVRKRWTERGPQDELTLVVSGTNSMSKESTYNVWVARNFSKLWARGLLFVIL